jgi:uncharacterized protein with PQ loop repeat
MNGGRAYAPHQVTGEHDPDGQGAYQRDAMLVPFLAVAASSWGVLMGISPVLQIRRMLRERSSRDVSLSYFMVLLAGFLLWISYGIAAGNMVLVIPNSVALLVGIALVCVALRLRRSAPVRSGTRQDTS